MGMTFDEMFPSRFFKADDVDPPLVLKIREVTLEALDGEDKKKKPVVYFVRHDKALALNKTNAAAIITLAGSEDTDDWLGTLIELYRDTVLFHGKPTPCVRVRRPTEKPPSIIVLDRDEPEPQPSPAK